MNFLTRTNRMLRRSGELLMIAMCFCALALAEGRSVEKRVPPVYPEIAKRMHISGVVHITASVAPSGSVTDAKAVDGNKMLAPAAEEAVRKWKFAAADAASTEVVQISFTL